ncbi:MAG: hypothetical protein IT522_15150 [Burkholderiales bacterium]|nr:hypothetical protein [Burkholderiales bacterium]
MPDPAYLAQLSSAMQAAVREAQGLVDEGELGAPLATVVRHARDLHDILVEELGVGSRSVEDHTGGALATMGERLRALERYLGAH